MTFRPTGVRNTAIKAWGRILPNYHITGAAPEGAAIFERVLQ